MSKRIAKLFANSGFTPARTTNVPKQVCGDSARPEKLSQLVSGSNRSGETTMQAWWIHTGWQWRLENSLSILVSFKDAHYHIGPTEYVLPPDLSIEQAKQYVAKKFAVMLIELAATVLTTEG
jgi:hypothetical protein